MKSLTRGQLPDWFDGEVYEIGDEVRNPFTGDSCLLNAAELSMYDLVKGAEMVLTMGSAIFDQEECIEIIHKGGDWLLANNPKAYMTLLD